MRNLSSWQPGTNEISSNEGEGHCASALCGSSNRPAEHDLARLERIIQKGRVKKQPAVDFGLAK